MRVALESDLRLREVLVQVGRLGQCRPAAQLRPAFNGYPST